MGTSPDPIKQREHCQRHAKEIAALAERMKKAADGAQVFASAWPEHVSNEAIVQLLWGIKERAGALADLIAYLEADLCFVRFGQTDPKSANDASG